MKKRYLSLLLLGISALSLSSCGYGEISFEEFKTQLTANYKKENPGFTKGKVKTEIKNYKFECSNNDLGSVFEGTLSAALKSSLIAQGFKIDKNADLKKGFSDSRDLTEEELKLATVRINGDALEGDSKSVKCYKNGDALKAEQVVEESGMKVQTTIYINEYAQMTANESSLLMEAKQGEDFFKLSLYASSTYTFSK